MTRHVIVIDANNLLVCMYRALFDTIDCTVVHAPHVRDALRLLHDADLPVVDLVVLDDRTVAGCDAELAARLHAHLATRAAPQISTCSTALGQVELAAAATGAATWVSKPLQLAAFTDLAQRCMSRSRTADALAAASC